MTENGEFEQKNGEFRFDAAAKILRFLVKFSVIPFNDEKRSIFTPKRRISLLKWFGPPS